MKLTTLLLAWSMPVFAQTDTLPAGTTVPEHPRILLFDNERKRRSGSAAAADPAWQKDA